MKISADPKHAWFHPDNMFCTVYLDGKKKSYVLTASEDDGFIEEYRVRSGRFICNEKGEKVIDRVYGKVRIEMDKPFASEET